MPVAIVTRDILADELSLSDLVLPAKVEEVLTFELTAASPGRPFGNCLALAGRGGTGKTSLGLALAKELDAEQVIMISSAPNRNEWVDIYDAIEDGTFILCDEIHTYGKHSQLLDLGEGGRTLGKRVQYWLFGATTDRAKMTQPLMSRFPVRVNMQYSDDEIERIADVTAERAGYALDDVERAKLIRASIGNPRTMRTIMRYITAGMDQAIRLAQLTADGLDDDAIAMLKYLSSMPLHASIGEDRLAKVLNAGSGIADVSAALKQLGYIEYTPGGICISQVGRRRLAPRPNTTVPATGALAGQ